jgi:hypothetical protein
VKRLWWLAACCIVEAACSSNTSSGDAGPDTGVVSPDSGASDGASADVTSPIDSGAHDGGSATDAGSPTDAGSTTDAGGTTDSGASDAGVSADAGLPAGWLYTQGNAIFVSGPTPARWMGRGVNFDDIFFCGYDNTLWMTNPDQTLTTEINGILTDWKPTFVRISLSMASYPTTTSWLMNPSQYKTPMTNVISAIGTHPGVYVLVTLRSDASMIGQDTIHGDPEATGIPSDATSTPNATAFPTGTDAVYQALVDSFAQDKFVLFGLTNEPGGNQRTNAQLSAAMSHAVGVIRAEEDKLGVPHHIVSVQGNNWTSDIGFYAASPLAYDNVVYEVHGYPPATASYTYANIPVIIGEYGSLGDSAAFFADLETKQIPNLAWDVDAFSDCAPDLLQVNQSATNLLPSAWGMTVKAYLTSH